MSFLPSLHHRERRAFGPVQNILHNDVVVKAAIEASGVKFDNDIALKCARALLNREEECDLDTFKTLLTAEGLVITENPTLWNVVAQHLNTSSLTRRLRKKEK